MNNEITKEQFIEITKQLKVPETVDVDYLFEAFQYCLSGSDEMVKANMFGKAIPINSFIIYLYLVNEYLYIFSDPNAKKDENYMSKLVSFTLDKYFTNEHLHYKNPQYTSKFSVVISTLEIYLNLMLGVLDKFPHNNPKETLLLDIANKALKLSKAISGLITSGFETEAFSTWRTLHETECILLLISQYGDQIIGSYLKHMNYAMAFRGMVPSKEETDNIFAKMKEEMKALDLKSKDMKKYIEYGWISDIPNFKDNTEIKFNFRDGVEKLAGLSSYAKLYEMASEIAHSSPLLIYSKNKYFYHLSILQLYESFFRIEKVFCQIYLNNISDEERKRYMAMRNIYYPTIIDIYNKEKESFKNYQTKKL